ncbi:MAG: Transcriptional regulator MntR [Promethearchaeota archaeon]|nr:MAG: Transcriptional regulator MntR [Candidatus Lokiarchaeota archaeon]
MKELEESHEDYLKVIYLISKTNRGGWVSNSEISDMLEVQPSSVTNMLYKLRDFKLIDWEPRKSMRLTKKGKEIAKIILKRYEVLKDFFINVLNLNENDMIDEICCKIEHHLTNEVSEALYNLSLSIQ